MADLQGFVDPRGDGRCSVLIPVFSAHEKANALQIQIVDDRDRVKGFETVALQEGALIDRDAPLVVEVFASAVWGFRDPTGKVHVGTVETLRRNLTPLLRDGVLSDEPVDAADLVQFLGLQHEFPDILVKAYRAMARNGDHARSVWRDSQILAPAVRRDLRRAMERQPNEGVSDDLFVFTRGPVIEVYTRDPWPDGVEMANTLDIAKAFGLNEISVGQLRATPPLPWGGDEYLIVGMGSVARRVMQDRRLHSNSVQWGERVSMHGAMARGRLSDFSINSTAGPSAFVAITQGDGGQIIRAVDLSRTAPHGALRHLICTRTIAVDGHWKRQANIDEQLYYADEAFDVVWFVAPSRYRNRDNNLVSIGPVHPLATMTSRLLEMLIDRSGEGLGLGLERMVEKVSLRPVLAVATALRYRSQDLLITILRQALHALLRDEVALETAHAIVVVLPFPALEEGRTIDIELGGDVYQVRIISRLAGRRVRTVLAYAVGVEKSRSRPKAYVRFCRGLFAPYGGVVRIEGDAGFEVYSPGGRLYVRPCETADEVDRRLSEGERNEWLGLGRCVLIVREVDIHQMQRARGLDWIMLHHGEIAYWMATQYDAQPFSDEARVIIDGGS